ncbi:MAG: sulfite exporter TauE/SafE family protein [Archaeoglobus sp.]|nr:sulfite exporter TauE/SafE family protein [Archaeoglobus sp.]
MIEYEYIFLPLFAFLISLFTSQAGVSGAFLILPFQISVLGFTSPAVSSTNLLYNVVSIPSGVYGYIREKRFILPLTASIVLGTLPGVFIGAFIRINYLPDPKSFKLFAGFVLFYLGLRTIFARTIFAKKKTESKAIDSIESVDSESVKNFTVRVVHKGIRRVTYEFSGESFSFSVPLIFVVSLLIGIVSGTYGVGGGAFVAPFLISVMGLPAYTIAGSTLFATFLTSIFGVVYYAALGYPPDLLYGILLGVGGIFGMYLGSRIQKFMPERAIRLILGILIMALSLRYITQYFI